MKENLICPICGEEFEPYHHSQKYCSAKCADAAIIKRRQKPLQPKRKVKLYGDYLYESYLRSPKEYEPYWKEWKQKHPTFRPLLEVQKATGKK